MSNNCIKGQYRQGDVLLHPVPRAEVTNAQREGEKQSALVLAQGKATGHHHSLSSRFAALYLLGAMRLLRVRRTVELQHQEHGVIPVEDIPNIDRRVIRQREFDGEYARQVQD